MEGGQEPDHVYIEAMDETQILSSLLWISELMGSKTDIDELLQLIVELTPKLMNLNRCSIFLWDKNKNEFVPRISYSPEREDRDIQLAGFYAMRVKPEEIPELAQKLMKEKVPTVVTDAETSTMIPKKYVEFFKIKSALIIPLLSDGEFIGAMVLDYIKNPHHFTQKEIRVAMGLSTHAALAIRNAQLISSLREEQKRTLKIIETMAEGLLVIAPERRIVMTNTEMARITGLTVQEILGLTCYNVYNGGIMNEHGNCCDDQCPLNTESQSPIKIGGKIRTRDGREVQISSNYSHIYGIDGKILYTVSTVRDISDDRWMENRLDNLTKKLRINKIGLHSSSHSYKGGI